VSSALSLAQISVLYNDAVSTRVQGYVDWVNQNIAFLQQELASYPPGYNGGDYMQILGILIAFQDLVTVFQDLKNFASQAQTGAENVLTQLEAPMT
jgi:hypothetical protein